MDKKNSHKYLIFQTSDEFFGVPIQDILTIEKLEYFKRDTTDSTAFLNKTNTRKTIQKINSYPPYVEGVIPYKGTLIPIIEFELFLYQKKMNYHEENKIIILKGKNHDYGILVDNVRDITELNKSNFEKVYDDLPIHIVEKKEQVYIIPDMQQIMWNTELLPLFEKLNQDKKKN